MPNKNYNPLVDKKIAASQPFAQPIMNHLRELVHKAVPEVTEEIKWGHTFFLLDGKPFANLAAFKEHCSFGFWKNEIVKDIIALGYDPKSSMGAFGRITSMKDIPSSNEMTALLKKAAELARVPSAPKKKAAPKPELPVPDPLAAALKKSKAATKHFQEFSTACRREYIEWINEAKREETRGKRIAQAIEWIAEGKQRNWKYQG